MDGVRYRFPLKAKYEKANIDIEALDSPVAASNDPLDAGEPPTGVDVGTMGESKLGPIHRGMYGIDRRGQKNPVDNTTRGFT